MLTFESLRDLIRDRGIAAQNGAGDLGLFGATSQTFVLSSVAPVSLTDSAPPQMDGSGTTGINSPFDLSAFGSSGGFWASLLDPQFLFEPYTSIAPLSVSAPQSASTDTKPAPASPQADEGQSPPAPSGVSTSPLVMMTNIIGPVAAPPGMPVGPVDSISLPSSLPAQTLSGATSDVMEQAQSALTPATIVVVATSLLGSLGDTVVQITAPLGEAIPIAGPLIGELEPTSILSIASSAIVDPVTTIVDEAAPVVSSLLDGSADVVAGTGELLASDIPDVAQQIVEPVAETISSVAEPVASVVEPLVQTLAPATGLANSIVGVAGEAVGELSSATTGLATEEIVGTVGASVAEAVPVVSTVLEEATVPVTDVVALLPTVVPDVTSDIVAPVARTVPFLGESIAPIVETLPTGPSGASSAAPIITGSVATATEVIASVPSTAADLTESVADDILPAVASLTDSVDQAPDTASDLAAGPAAIEAVTSLATQTVATPAAAETIVATVIDQPEPTNVATSSEAIDEPLAALAGTDVPSGIAVLTDLLAADTQFAIQDQQTGQDVFAPTPAPAELVSEIADLGTATPAPEAPDPIDHLLHDDSPLGGTLGHLFDNDGGLHG